MSKEEDRRKQLVRRLEDLEKRLDAIITNGKCGIISKQHYRITDIDAPGKLAYIGMPLATFVPPIVLSVLNTCMAHSIEFRLSVLIPYCIMFAVMTTHMIMYDPIARFCSKGLMNAHILEEAVVLCCIAAGISFVDLYTYEFAWYFAVLAVLFFYLSVGYFISSFWHKHSRFCTESQAAHNEVMELSLVCCPCIKYETCFVILSILFCACVVLITTMPIYYADDLRNSTRVDDPNCISAS